MQLRMGRRLNRLILNHKQRQLNQLVGEGQQHNGGADVEDGVDLSDAQRVNGVFHEGQPDEEIGTVECDQSQGGADDVEQQMHARHALGGGGGADAVLGFVRAANQLKVALGEDLGEDAIVQLAKMGDVMGTSKKMGVEKALLATGFLRVIKKLLDLFF